jgi:hypothetical protein
LQTGGVSRLSINAAGNVGIGIVNPNYSLQISTDSAGKLSSSTWQVYSDVRLKKNIRPFEHGLATLQRVEAIRYQFNGKGGLPEDFEGVGVDAKAMQAVLPETVSTHPGEIDGVETDIFDFNSHALFFVLINAVKELAARVETLEQRRN